MPTVIPLTLLAATSAVPQIDVYTMGQGQHLFERFGHAAICVTQHGRSRCFNYGTTDFGSPPEELGYAFLRGDAKFWVSVWARDRMLRQYVKHDRSVWRQRLSLPPDVARAVAARLEHDALPENRTYVYHHFRDNCSTRVRDVLDEASAGALRKASQRSTPESFRSLGQARLSGETGLVAIADLVVGRGADAPLQKWDEMFLPDALREQVRAQYGSEPEVIYTRRGPAFSKKPPQTPLWHVGAGGGLALAAGLMLKRPALRRTACVVVGSVLGTLALAVWSVAALSQVPELRFNEALLVFWPTDVLLLGRRDERRARYIAVRIFCLLLVAALLAAGVLRQPLLAVVVAVAAPLLVVWRASVVAARGRTFETGKEATR